MIKVPNLLISRRSPHPKLPAGCSSLRKVSWDGKVSSLRFESGGEWQSGGGWLLFFSFLICAGFLQKLQCGRGARQKSLSFPTSQLHFCNLLPQISPRALLGLAFPRSRLVSSCHGALLLLKKKKSEECSPLTLSNYLDLLITTKSTLVSWWKKQELVVTFPQRYFILSSVILSSVPTKALTECFQSEARTIPHVFTVWMTS